MHLVRHPIRTRESDIIPQLNGVGAVTVRIIQLVIIQHRLPFHLASIFLLHSDVSFLLQHVDDDYTS